MAKRHKGTTRKESTARPRRRSAAHAETPGATGADLLAVLDRNGCEKLVLETINALCTRTARPDGPRCVAFAKLDLATQFRAACLYLLDRRSLTEVAEVEDLSAVSTRVAERWIKIVKEEYGNRYNARLRGSETDADLAAIKGDMTALSVVLWGELTTKAICHLRQMEYGELDNNARHLFQRMAEGLSDQAKTQAEIEKARAQTEKINRQLRAAVDDKRRRGELSGDAARVIAELIDEAAGLRREGVAA